MSDRSNPASSTARASGAVPAPDDGALAGMLAFLEEAERLKDVLRSAHTVGGRVESSAEHSWRLCLWAMTLAPWLPELDAHRLLKLCVLHDLGEALHGDTPATEQHLDPRRHEREANDLHTLTASLPDPQRTEFRALWHEYDAAKTPEARIAKGIDKLETLLQHVQGANPPDFDYGFNRAYGRPQTDGHPLLERLRAPIDRATETRESARAAPGTDHADSSRGVRRPTRADAPAGPA